MHSQIKSTSKNNRYHNTKRVLHLWFHQFCCGLNFSDARIAIEIKGTTFFYARKEEVNNIYDKILFLPFVSFLLDTLFCKTIPLFSWFIEFIYYYILIFNFKYTSIFLMTWQIVFSLIVLNKSSIIVLLSSQPFPNYFDFIKHSFYVFCFSLSFH